MLKKEKKEKNKIRSKDIKKNQVKSGSFLILTLFIFYYIMKQQKLSEYGKNKENGLPEKRCP